VASAVIGFYTAHVALSAIAGRRDDDTVWLALSHAPSVAAQADGNVFEHPLFGQHVRFVLGLQAAGLLVGAGQSPSAGHGMTIIRVPAPAAADYVRAAQDDDPSVVAAVTGGRRRVERTDDELAPIRPGPTPPILSASDSDYRWCRAAARIQRFLVGRRRVVEFLERRAVGGEIARLLPPCFRSASAVLICASQHSARRVRRRRRRGRRRWVLASATGRDVTGSSRGRCRWRGGWAVLD